jgi:hypothetical protein
VAPTCHPSSPSPSGLKTFRGVALLGCSALRSTPGPCVASRFAPSSPVVSLVSAGRTPRLGELPVARRRLVGGAHCPPPRPPSRPTLPAQTSRLPPVRGERAWNGEGEYPSAQQARTPAAIRPSFGRRTNCPPPRPPSRPTLPAQPQAAAGGPPADSRFPLRPSAVFVAALPPSFRPSAAPSTHLVAPLVPRLAARLAALPQG